MQSFRVIASVLTVNSPSDSFPAVEAVAHCAGDDNVVNQADIGLRTEANFRLVFPAFNRFAIHIFQNETMIL